MSIALKPNEERDASYSILVHAGSEYPPVRYRAHTSIDMFSTMQNTTFVWLSIDLMCNLSSKVFASSRVLFFSLCSPIYRNAISAITCAIRCEISELHYVSKSYWKIHLLHKLQISTNYLHADHMLDVEIWVYLYQNKLFLQPSEHMCLREITHAFYIDEYAAFRVLLFYPKAII